MKTVTMPKRKKNGFTITIDQGKVSRGHQPHRSGSGIHADRRTGRNRTRSAQRRAALSELGS